VVEVKFWKMHGLGNDYVVTDNRGGEISENELSPLARKLCKRRFSVGADGLLLVYNSNIADVRMRVLNVDGSEAEMCGNGIRCFAKYCYENGIVDKEKLRIETLAGVKDVWLEREGEQAVGAKVDMGSPIWERSEIPMQGQGRCIEEELKLDDGTFKITCLSMGNPHCVIFTEDVNSFPIHTVGPKIENHRLFPNRVNVEFTQILSRNELRVRVWEKGCGETLACGTGACATVAAGVELGKVNRNATVHLSGGDLKIEYPENIFMIGPAEKVYEGQLF
jgi:diaminopimelate epimerase